MPVYVFGSGDCGQLGMGEDCVSAPHPISISSLQHLDIIQIAAGGLHSLALSANGQVSRHEKIIFDPFVYSIALKFHAC